MRGSNGFPNPPAKDAGGAPRASFSLDPSSAAPAAEPVRDVTTAEFMKEVIEESRHRPVLVDFWATWCGPCKQLAPILEKAVAATRGAVRLVKMDIDRHPEVAGQMGIQSIPAVVAFIDGRPADAFMGARSESEVKRFVEKLSAGRAAPADPIASAMEEAKALAEEGAASEAASLYAAVLQQVPDHAGAMAGLGAIYLDAGQLEQSRGLLDAVPADKAGDPAVVALRARLELAEQARELEQRLGGGADLTTRLEADPGDHAARFDLAMLLNAKGRKDEAAAALIEIIKRERGWEEGKARTQLLQFFEAWGAGDPSTLSARRKLSSVLFS